MHTKHFISLFLVGLSLVAFGQNEDPSGIYLQELERMVSIPGTPEAQSFAKYGDTDVSLYSGTPNVSIPLHTFQGREMSFSVGLTYDASPIKVEQMANWAGLSWNLDLGGRISRTVNGLADDFTQGNYKTLYQPYIRQKVATYLAKTDREYNNPAEIEEYFMFLDSVNRNFIDTQPDVFKLSAPGINTNIVFDSNDNYLPKSLDNPRIKIQVSRDLTQYGNPVNSWTVTNEDGTVYYFTKKEVTLSYGNDYSDPYDFGNDPTTGTLIYEYASSWLLTKIESSNKKDVFEIDYTDNGYWSQPQFGSAATGLTTPLVQDVYLYQVSGASYGGGAGYWTTQQFPVSVKYNNDFVMDIEMGARHDVDNAAVNTRLSTLNIYDLKGDDLKSVEFFNDDYFNLDGGTASQKDRFDIRLKLNEVRIKGKTGIAYEVYSFEYDRPDELPSRKSLAQDVSGLYNGKTGNNAMNTLIPRYEEGAFTFLGADRSCMSDKAKIGLLSKMTYPTGGYTTFDFEGNFQVIDVQDQVIKNYLLTDLSAVDETDESLYYYPDGSFYDDRYGFQGSEPKIEVVHFQIPEEGQYTIRYQGTALNEDTEAHIVFRGPLGDCNPFCITQPTFNTLSDFAEAPAPHKFWDQGYFVEEDKTFPAGNYQALIVLDEIDGAAPGTYGNVSLRIDRIETVTTQQNVDLGGIRIAKINDYGTDQVFQKGKKYTYANGISSFRPNLSFIKQYQGNTLSVSTSLVRKVAYPKGDQPMTVYPWVRERRINAAGVSEGYVQHTFYQENKGMVPRVDPPFESNHFPSLKGGGLKTQLTVDDQGGLKARQDIEYYETAMRPISVKGLVVKIDDAQRNKYVFIKQNIGHYTYEFVDEYDCSNSTPDPATGITFCNTTPCIGNWATCGYDSYLTNKQLALLDTRETFINGVYGGVSSTKDTLYFKNPAGVLKKNSKTQTVEFDPLYYLPKKTKVTDSKGHTYETTNTYPHEAGIAILTNKNNLVKTVESNTVRLNGSGAEVEFISARKNVFTGYAGNQVVVPTKVLTAKSGNNTADLEERVLFQYNTNGNLRESNQKDGPPTAYIWGYDNQYPIAKIENATYNDISSYVANLKTKSNADDDRTVGSTGKEGELRVALAALRAALPDAMVTSYTYDPSIGVTSMTDPRGYTIYYNYDDFNRLKEVRDADNNLVSDYQYNYKNQQ